MRKLNDLANRILDEKRPEMPRALDLYELQVGIFIPSQVMDALDLKQGLEPPGDRSKRVYESSQCSEICGAC